jgi:peptidoglycan/LPS O-acetylase OafA/YrhL
MSFTASVIPMLTMAVTVGYMHLMVESVSPEGKADWMAGNLDKVMENYWVVAYHAWGIGALLAGWVLIRVTRTDNGFAVVAVSLLMGAYVGLNYWNWPGSVGPFLVVSVLFFIGAYIADQRRQKVSKAQTSEIGDDTAKTD